jgi:hypothetical protein
VVWPKEEQEEEFEITCFSVIDHYLAIGTDGGKYAQPSGDGLVCVRVRVRVRVRFNVRATSGWSCWTSPRGTKSC